MCRREDEEEPLISPVQRFHQRITGIWPIILMIPVIGWVWLAGEDAFYSVFSGRVPSFVLSGKLFTEQFNYQAHAGFALDQPTIGKWLFWFTVMTLTSFPYAAVVRWLTDRRKKSALLAYGISVLILCTVLLCILTWPTCWLIQYVFSMEVTTRRLLGLVYATFGWISVIGFLLWAVRKPADEEQTELVGRNNGSHDSVQGGTP